MVADEMGQDWGSDLCSGGLRAELITNTCVVDDPGDMAVVICYSSLDRQNLPCSISCPVVENGAFPLTGSADLAESVTTSTSSVPFGHTLTHHRKTSVIADRSQRAI